MLLRIASHQDRRYRHVCSLEPPIPADAGQVGSKRDTHGGIISGATCRFILLNVLKIKSKEMERHSIFEFGSGSGMFAMTASSYSKRGQTVVTIENVPQRVERLRTWRENAFIAFRDDLGINHPSHFLPQVVEGNFLDTSVRSLGYHMKHRRLIVYCNNAKGVWSNDSDTQHLVERKLARCKAGSVVVTLDRAFVDDTRWTETIVKTNAPSGHQSWEANTGTPRDFVVYVYKKKQSDRKTEKVSTTRALRSLRQDTHVIRMTFPRGINNDDQATA